ncbi:hypothetical protein AWH48_07065 [Domibacillus aminovorans]|uniref:Uncharacterized protein n=1 Tax=Domibacillus aminovorans TaxID=29332 RepID=A0A177KMZ2_9BACI|nr:hypothetical protein [Domibacillus aminovorans]OAH54356.1 hypothetical protein AWH48_07065 [Domibacillus aminovorans]
MLLLIVLFAIGVAIFISIPLNKLAKFSEEATSLGYIKNEQLNMPNMKLVIYEVRQLIKLNQEGKTKQSFTTGIDLFLPVAFLSDEKGERDTL